VNASSSPLVSVVLPARDAERYVALAVRSILGQTLRELELIVVDDGSRDGTPAILAAVPDPRLVVLRNDPPLGLSASLNAGLERASGAYVARMDADDVALPRRLELQAARLRQAREVGALGSGVAEIDAELRLGRVHLLPGGPVVTRWRSLFGTPFYHPSVMLDRALLERHGLRYETSYEAGEPEDYELFLRLLEHAEGDNLPEPLLLYRLHEGQASQRRRLDQLELRERLALARIRSQPPSLSAEDAALCWRLGDSRELAPTDVAVAADAYLALLREFEQSVRPSGEQRRRLRAVAARPLLRAALPAPARTRAALLRSALALDPALVLHDLSMRGRRRAVRRRIEGDASRWLTRLRAGPEAAAAGALRVTVVSPEPTPYRSPLFDRLARRPEVELTVLYAARTLVDRRWQVEPEHEHRLLGGFRLPGLRRLLRHDYRITPGVASALTASHPDVVVVSGWSTFSSQAAIVWCRLHRVPFLLLVSSHDEGPRPGWRRRIKAAVVPRIVGRAEGALVLGTLSRRSLIARGARPESVRVFANTVDVREWGERADRLAARRLELRSRLGAGEDDVVVLCVGRLAPEKGLDTLVRAAAASGEERLLLVFAGSGCEAPRLGQHARELGVRLRLAGEVPWRELAELYVAADVFALLSEHEPWGVVVNEAAACGLPLLLSDRVGAAPDLLRDGENGRLLPVGDVEAAAAALLELASDPAARQRAGKRSRELVAGWDYETSVESFVEAVREAVGRLEEMA
jgi:glycosyltransferase involved in cell wall biosynthesis